MTNKIYVTNGNNLSVIDGVSNTVITTTALPSNNLTAIAVNPVTNFIYITATQSLVTVIAVNGATNSCIRDRSHRKQPFSVGGELPDEPDLRH